jgi:hypothetical protein
MPIVASYIFTAAAERAWEVLNQHLEGSDGGVFWIGGPAGCGKTHFLSYVIALQKRAGGFDTQSARRLVCGLELAGRISGAEVQQILLSVLAEQIGGDPARRRHLQTNARSSSAERRPRECATDGNPCRDNRNRLRTVELR